MQTLAEKELAALALLERCAPLFSRPVVAWSSGKDSQVLLHLCRRAFGQVPVLFFKERAFPIKQRFAHRVIEEWNLQVWDWPHTCVGIWEQNGKIDLVRLFSIGSQYFDIRLNLYEPQPGAEYACGLVDFVMQRPVVVGKVALPWNLIVMGSKDGDGDRTMGPQKLETDLTVTGLDAPAAVFPLRTWTDADVWEYTDKHEVMQNLDRYERGQEGWCEKASKVLNSDYYATCTSCFASGQPAQVWCPKLQGYIRNNPELVARIPFPGIAGYNPKKAVTA